MPTHDAPLPPSAQAWMPLAPSSPLWMEVYLNALFSIWWKRTDFRNLTEDGRLDEVGRDEEAHDGGEHGQEDAEYEGADDE